MTADPPLPLSETDRREVCGQHGWVGRRAFQLERHDLCEVPADHMPTGVDTDAKDDETGDEADGSETEPPRWSRAAATRQGIPAKKTIAVRRITKLELATGRAELQANDADAPYERPKTRGDCQWCEVCQLARDGKDPPRPLACGHRSTEVIWRSRPCVFVACPKSLFLDVSSTGSIILNFPHLEPGQMPADRSCALDLAERGAMTLEEIAVVTNLTRERIRQIELKALTRRARPAAIEMGLEPDDVVVLGGRHRVGPGADLEETGVEGAVPSDIATILGTDRDS